jgi:hypothetical protein
MDSYRNLGGDSGVAAYSIEEGAITVQLSNGWLYQYTNQSAGAANVSEMQRLARAGQGLNSYISRIVREGYSRKWR